MSDLFPYLLLGWFNCCIGLLTGWIFWGSGWIFRRPTTSAEFVDGIRRGLADLRRDDITPWEDINDA